MPDLERMLVHEPQLRATLRRLRGRKVIFSNAPAHYSRAVLKALGIADLFDDVFTIERTRYRPKPDTYGFLRLCRAHGLNPRLCVMVEDTLENLRTAARLGMKTVWVTLARRAPAYVDIKIANLMQLPRMLATLQ
jgi:putative hydrolase of the HAD superfamily